MAITGTLYSSNIISGGSLSSSVSTITHIPHIIQYAYIHYSHINNNQTTSCGLHNICANIYNSLYNTFTIIYICSSFLLHQISILNPNIVNQLATRDSLYISIILINYLQKALTPSQIKFSPYWVGSSLPLPTPTHHIYQSQ